MRRAILLSISFLVCSDLPLSADDLTAQEQLGKSIFFDQQLSVNRNQSCAECHKPESGWTGPNPAINQHGAVYEGSVQELFGNRKPPSSAYATQSPVLHYVTQNTSSRFVGGNFWDGRATGEKLGLPAADQAQGPFLNPVEQALPDNACVVYRVCSPVNPGQYPVSFEDVWGAQACDIRWPGNIESECAKPDGRIVLSDNNREKVNADYDNIALSIAAFEASPESNQFSSKFDYFLKGKAILTRQEKQGLELFRGKAKCANCHVIGADPKSGEPPLLTDFTYDNLGVPRNPENPWYTMPSEYNPDGMSWTDKGLGGFLVTQMDYQQFARENYGKQKVPTLRNVDKRPGRGFVKAYGHNGYFKSLEGIVNFYNTRDVKPTCPDSFTTEQQALLMNCWPEAEIPVNVNHTDMGNLGLSSRQEQAIVAFLRTLSDGYEPDGGNNGHDNNGHDNNHHGQH